MNITYTQGEIDHVAKKIIEVATSKTICLYGHMGAGKTTLIKAIVRLLNGEGNANSPTFGIVNEYHTIDKNLLGFHFDFYRLENEMEVLDLGFEDYLNQDAWIFIEWPEKIKSFLPEDAFNIHMEIKNTTTREIQF
ncbi:MAG: tRNA (adenosine(37)-N6)-threonylcarbamoyltransferase complex ATPase subunit type 1 TsaE [Maribacter sp.]